MGGGYAEQESGLSKLALQWMLDEAMSFGLIVNPSKRNEILGQTGGAYVPPSVDGMLHESLRGAWKFAEYIPKKHFDWQLQKTRRRMNLFRRRTIPANSVIHWSAYERANNYFARLPENVKRLPKK